MPSTELTPTEVAELRAAAEVESLWQTVWDVTGSGYNSDLLATYLRAGITVDRVERIGRLAAHAVAVATPVARAAPPYTNGTYEHRTAGQVLTAVIAGIEHDANADAAMAWAEVLVAEPGADRMEPMLFGIGALHRDWSAAGPLGPLAYAAGLTAVEATERQSAGTLAEDDLLLLAALRGYRFADC